MIKQTYVKKDSWIPRIAELMLAAGEAGFDCETKPLEQYKSNSKAGLDPYLSDIRLLQIAIKDYSWIIDLDYVKNPWPVLNVIANKETKIVIQNAKFETMHLIHKYDIFPENVFDTMLASQLLTPFKEFTKHGLGDIVKKWLGIEINKDEQKSDWSGELTESQIGYAFKDAEILLPLYQKLKSALEKNGMMKAAQIKFDSVLFFADMELTGICQDRDVLLEIDTVITARMAHLKKYLAYQFPSKNYCLFQEEGINLDSPAQVKEAFKEKTGISLLEQDSWGFDDKKKKKEGLKAQLVKHRKKFPKLVDALIDYGSLSHMKDSFCDKFLTDQFIHPVTGRMHPDYIIIGQDQQRSAVNKPNLNFARPNTFGPGVKDPIFAPNFNFKYSFRDVIVPREGNVYSIADFANNQLRIIADTPFANESFLQYEFEQEKPMPFEAIAARGLNKTKEQVTKEERQTYKMLTYALVYMAGLNRFMSARLQDTRIEVSKAQAVAEMDSFFKAVPGISNWHKTAPLLFEEKGYVESLSGNKIFIPASYATPNRIVNFPVCLTEVDGYYLAAGLFSRKLREYGYKSRPCISIYDEIVSDCFPNEAEEVLHLQEKCMIEGMQQQFKKVKASADGGIGKSWSDKP